MIIACNIHTETTPSYLGDPSVLPSELKSIMKPSLFWHTQLSDLPFTGGHLVPVGQLGSWAAHHFGHCRHSSPAVTTRDTRFSSCSIAIYMELQLFFDSKEMHATFIINDLTKQTSHDQCIVIASSSSISTHNGWPKWSCMHYQLLRLCYQPHPSERI